MSDVSAGRNAGRYREHRPWQDLDSMLSVDDARQRILNAVRPLDAQRLGLLDAHGLYLAHSVVAPHPVPPFRNSAMDGYAVRSEDVAGASHESPVLLRVISELPAGRPPSQAVDHGQAIRIMTGAAMPPGADTVVRFEETDEFDVADRRRDRSTIAIRKAPKRGDNVREAGEDVAAGAEVLYEGCRLNAAELGLLASISQPQVAVRRRPVIGILATGDEVVEPGEPISPGQIRNSNNYTIAGLVNEAGGESHVLGIAHDNTLDLKSKLSEISRFDMIVTSGGVSLGDYDVVKDVLQAEGDIELWQVRIKPGKPMAFGQINGVPLVGLPGNPVAAYVAFLQFVRPAIKRMLGARDLDLPTMRARLTMEHENRGHRRHYVRGSYRLENGELVVRPVATQGSGVLSSVTEANCLFVIPESFNHAPAGLEVEIIPLPVLG